MADRGDLLDAIKQGKRLKKTVTNDRSAPVLAGGSSSSSSGGGPMKSSLPPVVNSSTGSKTMHSIGGGGSIKRTLSSDGSSVLQHQRLPGIGGLFGEGGIPKLRPSGGPSPRSGREWTRPSVLPPEPRKAPLPIPKKSEAPPPPPLGQKPPFPSRTRSFNTGKSPGFHPPPAPGPKDDSSRNRSSQPRTLKPPNHPPPPPPIPKRNKESDNEEGGESFEARFGPLFKPVSSFPPPEPFTSIQKTYPSRNNGRKALSRSG